MAGACNENNKNNLLGDEECINFRPSPNFKHMKKYLKSKFEESNSSPNQSSDPSTTPNSEEQENIKPQVASSSSMAQNVQPPLPPNSPPPDSLVVPKQEVEDEEYNDNSATSNHLKTECDVAEKPAKIMCRQFARGMCTRGSACIYVHELILEQLPGVYTFCKNFQNKECKLPKCKFVHATVFEKEHFYRTGYLPPHSLIHLKESNSALGPPTALEGTPAEACQIFSNPPPALYPGVSSLPTSGSAPPETRPNTEIYGGNHIAALKPGMSAKREWNQAMAAHEPESEPNSKKCKTCDTNELRLQCAKTNMETLANHKKSYIQCKMAVAKAYNKINNVLEMIINTKTPVGSQPSKIMNAQSINSIRNEKDNIDPDNFDMFLKVASKIHEMDERQKNLIYSLLKIFKEKGVDGALASPGRR